MSKPKVEKASDVMRRKAYTLLRDAAEESLRRGLQIAADHCAREGRILAGKALAEYDAVIAECNEAVR